MTNPWLPHLPKSKTETLVELCRRPKINEQIAGFIVGQSKSHVLLHRLDWNTFTMDGYVVLRTSDVKKHRLYPHDSWPAKAIKKYKFRPQPLPGFPLDKWPETIAWIAKRFPLINVRWEVAYPDECHIGFPLKTTSRVLVLDCVGFDADWTGPWNMKLNQITRLDFGGGYERALALTVPKRKPKTHKQHAAPQPGKSLVKFLRPLRGLNVARSDEPIRPVSL